MESCNSPNTVECNQTAAIINFQLFAAAFTIPTNQAVSCITANITFNDNFSKPILSLGCGFSALSSADVKPSISTNSYEYSTCETDLCNSFPTVQPPNTITCYTCVGEPCGNNNQVQCTDSAVMNTFTSLSPSYGNFPNASGYHNFKCLFLNTTVSNNGATGMYILLAV